MSMKLIQNSGIPIYQQIADAFRSDILSGKMQQGEYLPSIRGLAKELKISVITTMKAYELLEEEGLVTASRAKASVSTHRIHRCCRNGTCAGSRTVLRTRSRLRGWQGFPETK